MIVTGEIEKVSDNRQLSGPWWWKRMLTRGTQSENFEKQQDRQGRGGDVECGKKLGGRHGRMNKVTSTPDRQCTLMRTWWSYMSPYRLDDW